jgi:hypothetical protein
MNIHL